METKWSRRSFAFVKNRKYNVTYIVLKFVEITLSQMFRVQVGLKLVTGRHFGSQIYHNNTWISGEHASELSGVKEAHKYSFIIIL